MGAGFIEIGLDRLQNADWLMIHRAIINNAPVRPTPRTPTGRFAWQQPVIDKAVEHFVAGGATRGRMQLPCGTGKSLIAYYVANALNANLVIVAVPSLALVRQSVHEVWLREEVARERMTDWLCVASDDTVGQVDDIADETVDIGLPTTTDAAEIAKWLRSPSERKIIFTTYQSSARLAEAARQVNVEFDLIILDEAHRTAGARDREFVTLLHNDKIKARRRLFMTATERKINGDDDAAFSMDYHAADYGARFYTMSFKEAITRDIITDYQIVTYVVTVRRANQGQSATECRPWSGGSRRARRRRRRRGQTSHGRVWCPAPPRVRAQHQRVQECPQPPRLAERDWFRPIRQELSCRQHDVGGGTRTAAGRIHQNVALNDIQCSLPHRRSRPARHRQRRFHGPQAKRSRHRASRRPRAAQGSGQGAWLYHHPDHRAGRHDVRYIRRDHRIQEDRQDRRRALDAGRAHR
jgi:superfamily II DNA or RNA helicase